MTEIRTPERSRPATDTDDIEAAAEAVRQRAEPLTTGVVNQLAGQLSDATTVLLGESSHGTAEYYQWRAELTARLVDDYGFDAVVVEGDWTDCYEVNRYVRGQHSPPGGAVDVLSEFDRWPTWMWANWEVVDFADWLRGYNDERDPDDRVGFYGMDVYSLFESMDAVIDYLEDVDPEAAENAREAYTCFEPYGGDAQEYTRSLRLTPENCEDEVIDVLTELRRDTPDHDEEAADAHFAAEQNALVAKHAEEYYRVLVDADVESWNVRDEHMVETIDRLHDHLGSDSKVVVWAHNTHVGDARATDMNRRGKVNVGQLVRERHGREETAIVGFGTHHGTVVAGESWDAPMEEMTVPPAVEGSYGDVFHRAGVGDAVVPFDGDGGALADPRGHRAIGVVYHPERELSNYVPTVLPDRYDAVVHVEESTALHPLHTTGEEKRPEETYPFGV